MTIESGSKACSKCARVLLLSEFYYDKARQRYRPPCKACFVKTYKKPLSEEAKAVKNAKRRDERAPRVQLRRAEAFRRNAEAQVRRALRENVVCKGEKGSRLWYSYATAAEVAEYRAKARAKYQRRYLNDPSGEKARVKRYKHANPERLIKWGRSRVLRASMSNDRTLTADRIKCMFAAAKSCPYCMSRFACEDEKTLDHIVPLAEGGQHSLANALICCGRCNSKKGAKAFTAWVELLPPKAKRAAMKIYCDRYRSPPEQMQMPMFFVPVGSGDTLTFPLRGGYAGPWNGSGGCGNCTPLLKTSH